MSYVLYMCDRLCDLHMYVYLVLVQRCATIESVPHLVYGMVSSLQYAKGTSVL